MRKLALSICLAFACVTAPLAAGSLHAAEAKTYQVTGPVLEITASYVVVQKGDEKWQIARDKTTRGDAMKVGDKVTIQYQMVAKQVEVKPAPKADAAPKSK